MDKIVIIGAGTMGNGIAHSFAVHHYNVVLVDLSKDKLSSAKSIIENNLHRQVKKGLLSLQEANATIERILFTTDATSKLSNCQLVIEAVSEKIAIKREVLKNIEKLVPNNTILTSNTSSISITKIANVLQRPENFIGMHFMNPVPVMQLVEVIKGIHTSQLTIRNTLKIIKKIEKTPIVVNDYPGFVANKILMPMINEAIYTLHEKTASVDAIDQIMILGMSHPMGPLKLADLIGLDVCLEILKVMQEGFGNPRYAPCPLLENLVNAKMIGIKSGLGFYDWSVDKKEPPVNKYFKN